MARTLVVDDDASIRQLLTYALSMEGHDVETLPDGREVVERLRASPARVVVLMDVMMPYVTGLDALRALMDEPSLLQRHSVILMSAGFPPDVSLPDGAYEMLPKPFNLRRALELVERLGAGAPDTPSSPGCAPVVASAPAHQA